MNEDEATLFFPVSPFFFFLPWFPLMNQGLLREVLWKEINPKPAAQPSVGAPRGKLPH